MEITIVGTGYVGLVSGTCFAEIGTNVTCVDVNEQKIQKLKEGIMPIYEPGLDDLVRKNMREGRLKFSTSLKECIENGAQVIFSAVGTPPLEDGSADLKYVLEVAHTIGRYATKYFMLVTKSTVPIGTAIKVEAAIREELEKRGLSDLEFDVASNPEFLKEGTAVADFMAPDRVVIGVNTPRAKQLMEKLYKPLTLGGFKIFFMDVASAEMTKYAANAMLATRISFMNQIAGLCEKVGADAENVRKAIGADLRIGRRFLYPGAGYGGSCFPKDSKALVEIGRSHGYPMTIIEEVEKTNQRQKDVAVEKLLSAIGGNINGKTIALWGLAFKPETDDVRESAAVHIAKRLVEMGAKVRAFDPIAMETAKEFYLKDTITYCSNIYDAATDADAIILATEWKQFRLPNWTKIKELVCGNIIIDGRNIYDEEELHNEGFKYYRIGKEVKND
ncbi:MAG: UDP-glucose/GDP-mannose dehydrogenase family protein [Flavobacteriales bacterium]|nr:UDP-glucose/GDP-mannose dehydrogenase family protein [Flavobacteriales bacterium]